MTLTEGKGPVTSLYIDSILLCVLLLLAVFVNCCSKPALAFALLLLKIIIITVMKTTTLTIKAVTNKLMGTVHTVLIFVEIHVPVFTPMGLMMLLVMFPQTTA